MMQQISGIRGLSFMTSALRGEGVPSKADIVSNLSKKGCMNLRTRGGGVKKSEIFADFLNGSPLCDKNGSPSSLDVVSRNFRTHMQFGPFVAPTSPITFLEDGRTISEM